MGNQEASEGKKKLAKSLDKARRGNNIDLKDELDFIKRDPTETNPVKRVKIGCRELQQMVPS